MHVLILGMASSAYPNPLSIIPYTFFFCECNLIISKPLTHMVTEIPDHIITMNCINFRDISFNKLTGQVPVNFGGMVALQYL